MELDHLVAELEGSRTRAFVLPSAQAHFTNDIGHSLRLPSPLINRRRFTWLPQKGDGVSYCCSVRLQHSHLGRVWFAGKVKPRERGSEAAAAMATVEKEKAAEREGKNLLGPPTFEELENGRFRCRETGHEMPAKAMESYGQCKRCRLGLIDNALSLKKPPLNMFKKDPLSRSKLICKLTGDTINKSEEHIWKHINGKRFLNKLEQKEAEQLTSNGTLVEQD
ncbi:hypothetical protein L1049_001971 [Liquidambar formosana]|uniref:Uncharacterized protein n=1 Tax=Liquidambar formosana TaxID=63359 RepID=A0AAP0NIK6_LIQFO